MGRIAGNRVAVIGGQYIPICRFRSSNICRRSHIRFVQAGAYAASQGSPPHHPSCTQWIFYLRLKNRSPLLSELFKKKLLLFRMPNDKRLLRTFSLQFRLTDAGKSEISKTFYANGSPVHIEYFCFRSLGTNPYFRNTALCFYSKDLYLGPALLSSSTSTIGGTAPSAANAPASAARLRNAIGIE